MRWRRFPELAALACLVAACGSTPRENFYTLAQPPQALPAASATAPSVVIGPVTIPDSVDRTAMVVRTGSTEVTIDDMNRWVEPLKTAIPRALADSLMRELGTPRVVAGRLPAGANPDFRVSVDVQRFESSLADGATLDAVWSVAPAQGAARSGRTFAREALPTKDYPGIAAAHRQAIGQLARDIAAAMK